MPNTDPLFESLDDVRMMKFLKTLLRELCDCLQFFVTLKATPRQCVVFCGILDETVRNSLKKTSVLRHLVVFLHKYTFEYGLWHATGKYKECVLRGSYFRYFHGLVKPNVTVFSVSQHLLNIFYHKVDFTLCEI